MVHRSAFYNNFDFKIFYVRLFFLFFGYTQEQIHNSKRIRGMQQCRHQYNWKNGI